MAKGMRCTGYDDGSRPIHLVIVGVSIHRQAQEAMRSIAAPDHLNRIVAFAVACARAHVMEYRGVRQLVQSLVELRVLPEADTRRWRALVSPEDAAIPYARMRDAGSASDGFLASCGRSAPRAVELRKLVSTLLSRGFALSTSALPDASLLGQAEAEAQRYHATGGMHSSTVKQSNAQRYTDPSVRGDVIRWLDGTDTQAPALAALTQWLRGELMDTVREACDASAGAPLPAGGQGRPRAHTGCGRAPAICIEPHTSLPLGMLACYPGGGTRFKAHVDNSPDAPDLRVVTAVLYLNGSWAPSDGGTLLVHPSAADAAVEVEPRRGTLVLFWSHTILHEVLPASATRFALSMWFSVDPKRQPPGWLEGRNPNRSMPA